MAANENLVILLGNLGQDPELKYTPSGASVCNFSMATNEKWTSKDGQKNEHTEWHRIVAWGKTAELCEKYLSKGRTVYLKGKLRTRQWEDREGNKRSTTEIIAQEVKFLGSGSQQTSQPQGGGGPPPAPNFEPSQDGGDDDMPFAANAVEFGIGDDPTPTPGRRAV